MIVVTICLRQSEPGLRLLEPRMSKTLDENSWNHSFVFQMTGQDNSTGPSLFYRTCIKQSRFDGQTSEAPPVDWTYNCRSETRSWYSRKPSETTRYSLFKSVGKTDYTACLNPDLVFSKLNVQWNYSYIKHLTTSEFVLSVDVVVIYSFSQK